MFDCEIELLVCSSCWNVLHTVFLALIQEERLLDDSQVMNEAAIEAYLERRQSQTTAGATLKAHLARLRLQSAREKANKERRAYRSPKHVEPPPQQQQYGQGLQTPGLIYNDCQERASSKAALRARQPNLAGPVARSWSHHHHQQGNTSHRPGGGHNTDGRGLDEPSESLCGILVLERAALLGTLSPQPFHPDQSKDGVCSLVDHCLLSLLLAVLSQVGDEREAQELAESLKCVPTHLKQRLAWQAQTAAPLPPPALQALLQSCSGIEKVKGKQREVADCWDEEENDQAAASGARDPSSATFVDDRPLTALHLAFSPLTTVHLRDLLHLVHCPAITQLDLTHTPNLSLGHVLLSVLPLLPNLISLNLACKTSELKPHLLSAAAFLSKLAHATPLLRSLDLSFNGWMDFEALQSIAWHLRWLHLNTLGLRGTPLALASPKSPPSSTTTTASDSSYGQLNQPRGGTLKSSASKRTHHNVPGEASGRQMIESCILQRRTPDGNVRPWVEVVL